MLAGNRKGTAMIRKLLLPALAAALLAGCATGYQYRGGSGDYYYGSPTTDYRYYGSPFGYYGGYGYGGYGSPYGWGGYGYYSSPYYYYGSHYRHRSHDHWQDHQGDNDDGGNEDRTPEQQRPTPPWRDLGALRERREMPATRAPSRPITSPMIRPNASAMPRARSGGDGDEGSGSRLSEMLRRSQQ